ncbi:hypothetical protein [Thermoflexus sp.]|uniref:hypothetical protein n=1 Tax=Thermoflexus sp. TaxID=1969742 RepID=UPI0035E4405B
MEYATNYQEVSPEMVLKHFLETLDATVRKSGLALPEELKRLWEYLRGEGSDEVWARCSVEFAEHHAGLRRLCRLLLSASAEDPARLGEVFRCHIGAQIVAMALDRWEGWLSLPTAQRQLADLCRSLRLHGLTLPETLAALLGAQRLRSHDPAWALEMARRAERLLGELRRAAVLRGRPHAELFDGIQYARRLIREILDHTSDSEAASRAEKAPEPPPASEASSPAPMPPEAAIPAPGWPLRPARLFLIPCCPTRIPTPAIFSFWTPKQSNAFPIRWRF